EGHRVARGARAGQAALPATSVEVTSVSNSGKGLVVAGLAALAWAVALWHRAPGRPVSAYDRLCYGDGPTAGAPAPGGCLKLPMLSDSLEVDLDGRDLVGLGSAVEQKL